MSIGTVAAMVDWVEAHLEEDPELAKMASHVGYSEFYCSAKFHEIVGVPFKEYVFRRKLALAADTLVHSSDRIIEIAMRYGFSSNEAFSRAFKKVYGCSPNQFRARKPKVRSFDRIQVM